jgi:hypothetical protein
MMPIDSPRSLTIVLSDSARRSEGRQLGSALRSRLADTNGVGGEALDEVGQDVGPEVELVVADGDRVVADEAHGQRRRRRRSTRRRR